MILKCDEPLSNVAFKFNLRHYTKGKTTKKQAKEGKRARDFARKHPDMRISEIAANEGWSASGADGEVTLEPGEGAAAGLNETAAVELHESAVDAFMRD